MLQGCVCVCARAGCLKGHVDAMFVLSSPGVRMKPRGSQPPFPLVVRVSSVDLERLEVQVEHK